MTSITRTVTVRLTPDRAFEVFTSHMDAWFPRGPHSFNYADKTVGVELEPGVGGRWREVWDEGDGYEIGRVLAWEPGRRLVLTYRNRYLPPDPLTEIEVRFEPEPGGTRVTLEHRGWEWLPPEALQEWSGRAWRQLIAAFAEYTDSTDEIKTRTENTPMATQEALRAHDSSLDRQAVVPILFYEDGVAAMKWLADAFGFVERTRWLGDDGTLAHGEMVAGGGLIMLAGGLPAYESPRRHRETCSAAASWSTVPWVINGVLVHVDDVDVHFAQAVHAGARILSEPEDSAYGRSYRVEDLEGNRWMFMADPRQASPSASSAEPTGE